jgi:hypothetical protein
MNVPYPYADSIATVVSAATETGYWRSASPGFIPTYRRVNRGTVKLVIFYKGLHDRPNDSEIPMSGVSNRDLVQGPRHLKLEQKKAGRVLFPILKVLRRLNIRYSFYNRDQPNVTVEPFIKLLRDHRTNYSVQALSYQKTICTYNGHITDWHLNIAFEGKDPHFNFYVLYDTVSNGYKLNWHYPHKNLPINTGLIERFWKGFLTLLAHIPINDRCSTSHFRVNIWTVDVIMNEDGDIVDPTTNQKVTANHTTRTIWVRLSKNYDIQLCSGLFCAMQVINELRETWQEHYDGQTTGEANEGFDIHFMQLQMNCVYFDRQVKGKSYKDGYELLRSWRNHENEMVRWNYNRAWGYLKENNLQIWSPSSHKSCVATAFLIGLKGTIPKLETRQERKNLTNKAYRLMRKFPKDKLPTLTNVLNYLSSLHPEVLINVRNFRLETIWEKEKVHKSNKRRKHFGKKIELWVGAGHCFTILPNFNEHMWPPVNTIPIEEVTNVLSNHINKIRPYSETRQKSYDLGVFDIETTTGFGENKFDRKNCVLIDPYCIGMYLFKTYKLFIGLDCVKQFVDYLFQLPPAKYQLYAHNGGTFDFLFVLKELFLRNTVAVKNCLEIDGSLVNISILIRHPKTETSVSCLTKITFRDSCPLFSHQSLEVLADTFAPEVPKLVGTVHHDLITKDNFTEHLPEVEKYLYNDVLGLYTVLINAAEKFSSIFKLNILNCFTSSSLSRKFFLGTHYNQLNYPLYNLPIEMDNTLRNAYYGGRCECFKIGTIGGPIYYYDVTSEYPYTMTMPMPFGLPTYKKLNEDQIQQITDPGIYHVMVKGKSITGINILPYKSENGLIFPNFESWTKGWWYWEELNLALKYGYQVIPIEAFVFGESCYFKETVIKLFELKKEARKNKDKGLETMAKVMINSLYGFWATRVQDIAKLVMHTTTTWDSALYFIETYSLLSQIRINNTNIYRVRENLDIDYSYVPISIACTARARIYIWELINNIEQRGGKVYYCDTDSVITNFKIEGTDYENIIMKDRGIQLGEIKNEFGYENFVDLVTIIGPKMYAFQNINREISKEHAIPKLKGFYKRFLYKRSLDSENKIVHFTDPQDKHFADQEHVPLRYQDFELLEAGWAISVSTWRFRSKMRAYFDDFQIRKEKVSICFTKNYYKGIVEEDGSIQEFTINKEKI